MAAKPNCLIVCSSATQGMDNFSSVGLSVQIFRGISYLRFPKYLSHIFCARKGEKTVNPCMLVTLVTTVMFFLIGRLTLKYFIIFMDFRCVSPVLHSRIHADAFSFQCPDCNTTSKKDIQLRAVISILLGHSFDIRHAHPRLDLLTEVL